MFPRWGDFFERVKRDTKMRQHHISLTTLKLDKKEQFYHRPEGVLPPYRPLAWKRGLSIN
jgi:hypothetical protein